MSFLLDTNIVSELRVRRRSSEPVFAWRDANLGAAKAISVMSILELEFGAQRAFDQRLQHAQLLRDWIDHQVMPEFEGAILQVDVEVAKVFAKLLSVRTFSYVDGLIAATALVHGLIVVTRDVEGFTDSGVPLVNPWAT